MASVNDDHWSLTCWQPGSIKSPTQYNSDCPWATGAAPVLAMTIILMFDQHRATSAHRIASDPTTSPAFAAHALHHHGAKYPGDPTTRLGNKKERLFSPRHIPSSHLISLFHFWKSRMDLPFCESLSQRKANSVDLVASTGFFLSPLFPSLCKQKSAAYLCTRLKKAVLYFFVFWLAQILVLFVNPLFPCFLSFYSLSIMRFGEC